MKNYRTIGVSAVLASGRAEVSQQSAMASKAFGPVPRQGPMLQTIRNSNWQDTVAVIDRRANATLGGKQKNFTTEHCICANRKVKDKIVEPGVVADGHACISAL